MKIQNNIETCYWRGNRSTRRKTSLRPFKSKLIHQWISWSTRISRRPS